MHRNFPSSRIFSGNYYPVLLYINVPIGATGAVGTVTGPYIKAVTRMAAGIYQVQFQDNVNRYVSGFAQMISPASGSAADPHGLNIGTLYTITTVGDTDWVTAGIPLGVTPAIGVSFVLAAQPAAGTGRMKAVGDSGVARVELACDPSLECAPTVANSPSLGAIILIQCLQAQVPSATTQGTALQYAPADPVSGSVLKLAFLMSNSSLMINGA
jgi:hypothetical protein